MRDPDAALAGWVRRDLALPLVLLAVQLTGAAVVGGSFHLFGPTRPPGAVDWVLLAVGPVVLVVRRRYPVAALWVSLAATLASASGFAHVSFIVAFFVAATAGRRYAAWLVVALAYVWRKKAIGWE